MEVKEESERRIKNGGVRISRGKILKNRNKGVDNRKEKEEEGKIWRIRKIGMKKIEK